MLHVSTKTLILVFTGRQRGRTSRGATFSPCIQFKAPQAPLTSRNNRRCPPVNPPEDHTLVSLEAVVEEKSPRSDAARCLLKKRRQGGRSTPPLEPSLRRPRPSSSPNSCQEDLGPKLQQPRRPPRGWRRLRVFSPSLVGFQAPPPLD